jgi:RNA polymerase sigma-70 factor, ECF subfamily
MMSATPLPASPPDDDRATIEACRRGERAALERVFRAEAPRIERQIAWLVGPRADVEDLLQTTMIAAVEAFPRFRGEASVRTWLSRIAVNVVHDHLRRPERRRRVALELIQGGTEIDPAPGPDRVAENRRLLERLYRILDTIGPKKRVSFVLHVFEGLPIDHVAALMSATKVATKSRVFFARRALLARIRKDPELREWIEDSVGSRLGGAR